MAAWDRDVNPRLPTSPSPRPHASAWSAGSPRSAKPRDRPQSVKETTDAPPSPPSRSPHQCVGHGPREACFCLLAWAPPLQQSEREAVGRAPFLETLPGGQLDGCQPHAGQSAVRDQPHPTTATPRKLPKSPLCSGKESQPLLRNVRPCLVKASLGNHVRCRL